MGIFSFSHPFPFTFYFFFLLYIMFFLFSYLFIYLLIFHVNCFEIIEENDNDENGFLGSQKYNLIEKQSLSFASLDVDKSGYLNDMELNRVHLYLMQNPFFTSKLGKTSGVGSITSHLPLRHQTPSTKLLQSLYNVLDLQLNQDNPNNKDFGGFNDFYDLGGGGEGKENYQNSRLINPTGNLNFLWQTAPIQGELRGDLLLLALDSDHDGKVSQSEYLRRKNEVGEIGKKIVDNEDNEDANENNSIFSLTQNKRKEAELRDLLDYSRSRERIAKENARREKKKKEEEKKRKERLKREKKRKKQMDEIKLKEDRFMKMLGLGLLGVLLLALVICAYWIVAYNNAKKRFPGKGKKLAKEGIGNGDNDTNSTSSSTLPRYGGGSGRRK